jgi:hypothetical protein
MRGTLRVKRGSNRFENPAEKASLNEFLEGKKTLRARVD